ncbi:MAG: hypothetical protein IT165_16655 [Bryobacterales bacterium]|nr:hypothetical protein [Bryobacterales bacterium]
MSRVLLLLGYLCLHTAFAQPGEDAPVVAKSDSVVELSSGETPALPDWRVRRHVLLKQMFGPQAVLEVLPGLAFDESRGFPGAWGRGPSGLAKRFGNQYGQFVIGEFIEFGVSSIHNEDPRYFRLGDGTAWQRTRHVFKNTFFAYHADGSPGMTLAAGRILGVYGAWGVATRWNPPAQQTVSQFLLYGTVGMLTKTGGNAMREFWPDVKRRFFHKSKQD